MAERKRDRNYKMSDFPDMSKVRKDIHRTIPVKARTIPLTPEKLAKAQAHEKLVYDAASSNLGRELGKAQLAKYNTQPDPSLNQPNAHKAEPIKSHKSMTSSTPKPTAPEIKTVDPVTESKQRKEARTEKKISKTRFMGQKPQSAPPQAKPEPYTRPVSEVEKAKRTARQEAKSSGRNMGAEYSNSAPNPLTGRKGAHIAVRTDQEKVPKGSMQEEVRAHATMDKYNPPKEIHEAKTASEAVSHEPRQAKEAIHDDDSSTELPGVSRKVHVPSRERREPGITYYTHREGGSFGPRYTAYQSGKNMPRTIRGGDEAGPKEQAEYRNINHKLSKGVPGHKLAEEVNIGQPTRKERPSNQPGRAPIVSHQPNRNVNRSEITDNVSKSAQISGGWDDSLHGELPENDYSDIRSSAKDRRPSSKTPIVRPNSNADLNVSLGKAVRRGIGSGIKEAGSIGLSAAKYTAKAVKETTKGDINTVRLAHREGSKALKNVAVNHIEPSLRSMKSKIDRYSPEAGSKGIQWGKEGTIMAKDYSPSRNINNRQFGGSNG